MARQFGPNQPPKFCRKCGGSGTIIRQRRIETCPRCGGTGLEPERELTNEQQTLVGLLGGGAIGYSLGGPAGAVVGGLIGAALAKQEDNKVI